MTNEELLRRCKTHLEYGIDTVTPIEEDFNELFLRFEKQIPKKVIFDKNEQIWKNKCPNCNAGYLELEYLTEKYKFCITCGQALDWGDKE